MQFNYEKFARNRNGKTYAIFIKKSKLLSNTEKIYIDGLYLSTISKLVHWPSVNALCVCKYSVQLCKKYARYRNREAYTLVFKKTSLLLQSKYL